jgi:hypothetical protein
MNYLFFFGHDKAPFTLTNDGMVETNSTIPFHGIISRGMLNKFIEHGLQPGMWHEYGHQLQIPASATDPEELKLIRQIEEDCKVLSFAQSASCVRHYIETDDKADDELICEIWNIKEGHTTSVWKVSIVDHGAVSSYVVNVARDADAGLELLHTSEKMKIIGDYTPEINMAKVHDIRSVNVPGVPFDVVVAKNDWVDNAYEIHSRTNKQTGEGQYILVGKFLTDKQRPAHITSVFGRVFSVSEKQKIEHDIDLFLTKASVCLSPAPEINFNDGDIVWNGRKAIVVAVS